MTDCRTEGRNRSSQTAALMLFASICLVAGAVPATAQQTNARTGQWMALGIGTGVDRVTCDVCAGDLNTGLSGFGRFGGTLSSKVRVGAQVSAWTRSEQGRGEDRIRETMWSLMGLIVYRPGPSDRLHFTGGLGLLGYRASEDGSALTSTTLGLTAGVGYDVWVRPDLSVAPFAQLMIAPHSSLNFNGETAAGNARFGMLQAGLELTWH